MIKSIKAILASGKTGRAQASLLKGNYENALRLIDKAISLDPDIWDSPVNFQIKGICHYHLNEKEIAKEYLEKAEERLLPLLDDDNEGQIRNELSRVQYYIKKCG